jgi:hypothetical protein
VCVCVCGRIIVLDCVSFDERKVKTTNDEFSETKQRKTRQKKVKLQKTKLKHEFFHHITTSKMKKQLFELTISDLQCFSLSQRLSAPVSVPSYASSDLAYRERERERGQKMEEKREENSQ